MVSREEISNIAQEAARISIGKAMNTDCFVMAFSLTKAFGFLNYGEARAVQGYTGDTRNAVYRALSYLEQAGIDKEDLEDILQPLEEIKNQNLNPAQIQSRLQDAQEGILAIIHFPTMCECSKAKAIEEKLGKEALAKILKEE